MEMLLGLIDSLNLNATLFKQFVLFLITYGLLYYLLFKPYNRAAQTRYNRTKGNEESADKYDEEIELLKRKYSEKVRETNKAVKEVFQQYDITAKKESSDLMIRAQEDVKKEKLEKEERINKQYNEELEKVPALAQELKDQLKKVLVGM